MADLLWFVFLSFFSIALLVAVNVYKQVKLDRKQIFFPHNHFTNNETAPMHAASTPSRSCLWSTMGERQWRKDRCELFYFCKSVKKFTPSKEVFLQIQKVSPPKGAGLAKGA